jgi:uncharacterized membrane protein
VLNRVLRHNLRNDLTGAMGYTRLLVDDPDDVEILANRITEHHEELLSIGAKSQGIQKMLEADRDTDIPVPLSDVVANSIREVRSDSAATLPPIGSRCRSRRGTRSEPIR